MRELFDKLAATFAPSEIQWRVGPTTQDKTKGIALAFIDARTVMHRLDEATGGLWQCEYVPMPNGTCCCRIGIKVGDEWLWRSNGAINLSDSDKTDQKEMAEKGSYSDAFKRAAVLWGIGQYLYDLDSPWVEIKPMGKSYVITDAALVKLGALLPGATKAHVPADVDTPRQTQQGRKNEAEGIKNARTWVNESLPYLRRQVKTKAELDKFQAENAKKIEWIRTALPDEFDALDHALNIALERVNTLVAG